MGAQGTQSAQFEFLSRAERKGDFEKPPYSLPSRMWPKAAPKLHGTNMELGVPEADPLGGFAFLHFLSRRPGFKGEPDSSKDGPRQEVGSSLGPRSETSWGFPPPPPLETPALGKWEEVEQLGPGREAA